MSNRWRTTEETKSNERVCAKIQADVCSGCGRLQGWDVRVYLRNPWGVYINTYASSVGRARKMADDLMLKAEHGMAPPKAKEAPVSCAICATRDRERLYADLKAMGR